MNETPDLSIETLNVLKDLADVQANLSDFMSLNHKLLVTLPTLTTLASAGAAEYLYERFELTLSGICHSLNEIHKARPQPHEDCFTCCLIAEGKNPLESFSERFIEALIPSEPAKVSQQEPTEETQQQVNTMISARTTEENRAWWLYQAKLKGTSLQQAIVDGLEKRFGLPKNIR